VGVVGIRVASNALEADSRLLRAYLLLATVLIFIAGLAVPRAFGNQAILFTGAYVRGCRAK
jgi:hypothetical protein